MGKMIVEISENEMKAGFRSIYDKKEKRDMLFLVIHPVSEGEIFLFKTKSFQDYNTPDTLRGKAYIDNYGKGVNTCLTTTFYDVKEFYENPVIKKEKEEEL